MSPRLVLLLLVVPIGSVCLFGQGAQLQITNASLTRGQQGNIYSEVFRDVGFRSYVGGNYQLQPTSSYKNRGTDGKDLGADIVGLNLALKGVE